MNTRPSHLTRTHNASFIADALWVRVLVGVLMCTAALTWLLAAKLFWRQTWSLTAALALLAGLTFTALESRWFFFERSLAHAVEPIIGSKQAGFGCERLTRNMFASKGFAGHVMFDADGQPAREAFLSATTCDRVRDYIANPAAADLKMISAVHVVAHEAAHLAGERNEANAECWAMREDPQVMQRLGASYELALRHAALYRKHIYPRLTAEYRSTACTPELSWTDESPNQQVNAQLGSN